MAGMVFQLEKSKGENKADDKKNEEQSKLQTKNDWKWI